MQSSATKEESSAAPRADDAKADDAKADDAKDDKRFARAFAFADLSRYTFRQRITIRAAGIAFYLAIRLLGATARLSVEGWENWEEATRGGGLPIYTCWHDRIFLGTYFWRGRGLVAMTSRSFDGEYIARFMRRFGYGAARGSSSRGGVGALVEMTRLVHAGCPTAFTIDGPRGPRHEAKMGAVLLAKKTGQAVLPFTVNSERFWEVSSWDRLQIPKPFTRATVHVAPPIRVAADADEETLNAKRDELQRVLDALSG